MAWCSACNQLITSFPRQHAPSRCAAASSSVTRPRAAASALLANVAFTKSPTPSPHALLGLRGQGPESEFAGAAGFLHTPQTRAPPATSVTLRDDARRSATRENTLAMEQQRAWTATETTAPLILLHNRCFGEPGSAQELARHGEGRLHGHAGASVQIAAKQHVLCWVLEHLPAKPRAQVGTFGLFWVGAPTSSPCEPSWTQLALWPMRRSTRWQPGTAPQRRARPTRTCSPQLRQQPALGQGSRSLQCGAETISLRGQALITAEVVCVATRKTNIWS